MYRRRKGKKHSQHFVQRFCTVTTPLPRLTLGEPCLRLCPVCRYNTMLHRLANIWERNPGATHARGNVVGGSPIGASPSFKKCFCKTERGLGCHSLPLQECCEMCRIVSAACKGARRHVARPRRVCETFSTVCSEPTPLSAFWNMLLGTKMTRRQRYTSHGATCRLLPGVKDALKFCFLSLCTMFTFGKRGTLLSWLIGLGIPVVGCSLRRC